jgi:predicted NUDIX family phosphoesterase
MGRHDGSESVLCVPNSEVGRWFGSRRGFVRPLNPGEIEAALTERAEFRPRTDELEGDESWRQLIPYGLLCRRGRIFAYSRTRQGGEGRLHGRASLGIGGHIDIGDAAACSLVVDLPRKSLDREMGEEVGVHIRRHRALIGYLVLDDTPVDRVHLGIVYADVPIESRVVPGPEVDPLGWFSEEELASLPRDWEGWSRAIIEALSRDQRHS